MQITIPKLSRQERDEFFRKNKWLIKRLWGINVCFPDFDGDSDDDDDQDGVLERHTAPAEEAYDSRVDKALADLQDGNKGKASAAPKEKSEEELEEELEALEDEIEDILDDIEDDLEEMAKDGLDDDEKALNEEIGAAIDDLQEALDDDDDSAESDNDKPDDLTRIKGLGPKSADKLHEMGITSFRQVAEMTEEEVEKIDEKVRNFAKSYSRKKFRQQAKDLL